MRRELIAWACRAVVSLYPPRIRERYGDEILQLLSDSPTPARDLVNVAWCAAAEHRGGAPMSNLAKTALRAGALLILPLALLIGWASTTYAAIVLAAVFALDWLPILYFAVPAAVNFPLAIWLARRLASRSSTAWPVPVLPIGAALGALAIAALPGAGQIIGEVWAGSAAAIALWCAGIVAIGVVTRSFAARAPSWAVVAGLSVLGVALLECSIAVYLAVVLPRTGASWSWSEAPLWFPVSVAGMDGSSTLAGRLLHDTLKFLPHLLTMLTVFILAWQAASARRPPEPARSGVPATSLAVSSDD